MKILLIGPQGSGKSTQGKLLSEFLKIPVISTGDIFRAIKKQYTEEGRRIKEIYEAGKLIDDETTASLVEKRLQEEDCQNGYILDGYPRTLEQINFFDPRFDRVFYLKLSDEEALKRLLKRGREDDTKNLISQRLKLYHDQTDPILDYYQSRGLLRGIDGVGTIEEVQQRIRNELNG